MHKLVRMSDVLPVCPYRKIYWAVLQVMLEHSTSMLDCTGHNTSLSAFPMKYLTDHSLRHSLVKGNSKSVGFLVRHLENKVQRKQITVLILLMCPSWKEIPILSRASPACQLL